MPLSFYEFFVLLVRHGWTPPPLPVASYPLPSSALNELPIEIDSSDLIADIWLLFWRGVLARRSKKKSTHLFFSSEFSRKILFNGK
jgi:hypothetical protein